MKTSLVLDKYLKSEDVGHFVVKGVQFGYPECCIKEFIENRCIPIYNGKIPKEQVLINNFSGFIPCIKHAKQVKSGKITLSSLIQPYRSKELPKFKEIWDK